MSPGLDPSTRYLIVNADDLGASEPVNRAVFAAHERGIVTSASLMATAEACASAARGARERPGLSVGVHLVLHGERPAAPLETIPALVGPDGRLGRLRDVVRGLLRGALDLGQVEREWSAQIVRAREAGVEPSHLDSHCHLHALPSLARLLHSLGARHGIPCARRVELSSAMELLRAAPARAPLALAISASHRLARARLPHALRTPARFFGLSVSGAVDPSWLEDCFERLPRGAVSELMVHPAEGDPHAPPADHGPRERAAELAAVSAPRVRAALDRAQVQLVNYRFLAAC